MSHLSIVAMLSPILSCDNISKSIQFYESLGFEKQWALDEDTKITFANVKFFDTEILLGTIDFVEEDKRDMKGIGIQLYIEVPPDLDIEELYQKAQSTEVNIHKHLEDRPWGERVFAIYDRDGYNLMFAQRKNPS